MSSRHSPPVAGVTLGMLVSSSPRSYSYPPSQKTTAVDECEVRTLRPSSAIADFGRRRPKLDPSPEGFGPQGGERPAFAAEAAASAE